MSNTKTENIEIELLLKAIDKQYGYDFSHYSRSSLKRRIKNFLSKNKIKIISELIPKLLYDRDFFQLFLYNISVTVTEMFRDPLIYKSIRDMVIQELKHYPFLKIWHAGCATGEEVYSMAILLKEEGLYDRCQIYATDFNNKSLESAKEGIFPLEKIKEYTDNYRKFKGKQTFSDYYHAKYNSAILAHELKTNITFANHNLVTDSVFGEMNFIICRNVLIYFDRDLQSRVLTLFYDSLAENGFLWLGSKESLRFSSVDGNFTALAPKEKIFQKIG